MKDVAKLAGVSVGTISHVLNHKRVSSQTKQKVMRAVRMLDYTPHAIAKKLVCGRTECFGLLVLIKTGEVITSAMWGFLLPIIQGILDVLEEKDFSLQLHFCNQEKVGKDNFFTELMKQRAVDGLFILIRWSLTYSVSHDLFTIAKENFPFVLINENIPEIKANSVRVNYFQGARNIVDYLVKLNHFRIGLITGPLDSIDVVQRTEGYARGLRDHDIPYDSQIIREGDFSVESAYHCMESLLKVNNPPTAVFCANDHMAAGAIKAIKKRNMRVPEDISVIGFDDQEIAKVNDPPITTMRQPLYEIGSTTARIMFDLVNKKLAAMDNLLKTELVIRKSCTRRR